MSPVTPADVLVRCDVGTTLGIGHLMRCVALCEELLARGLRVLFCADVAEVPLARRQLEARGIAHVPAVHGDAAHARLVREVAPSLVVVDSYVLPPSTYDAMRGLGAPLLAFVDGELGGRVADLYLDQNIGAELDRPVLPPGAVRLAGLRYALMRDEVRRHRPAQIASRPGDADSPVPRVLAVFGGTDAYGAAPVLAAAVLATGRPCELTVVRGRADLAPALEALAGQVGPGQRMSVIEPTDRLAELVVASDLVVGAAGTSTWELFCLGAACALIAVVDNQAQSYERVVDQGLAVGLGYLGALRSAPDEAVCLLTHALASADERARLRSAVWREVDGRGRERVADACLGLQVPQRPTAPRA